MNNLASALGRLGRQEEAIAMYRRLVPLQEALMGQEHMDTLASKNNLAKDLHEIGRHAEALTLFEEVLETGSEVLGPSHSKMLAVRMFMGDCHYGLDQLEEAIAIYGDIVPKTREVLGSMHPQAITRGHNLAFYLAKAKRFEEAEPIWEEVVNAAEASYGPNDVRLAKHLQAYAEILSEEGRPADAASIFKHVEVIYRENLGAGHEDAEWAKVEWLSSRRQAGEALTPEEVEEVQRLYKKLTGQNILDVYRSTSEARKEAPDTE